MVARIWASSRTESLRLMGHFKNFDLDAGGIVSLDVPTFVAHVADGEEVDGSVAFAHHDAVVNVTGCDGSVDS